MHLRLWLLQSSIDTNVAVQREWKFVERVKREPFENLIKLTTAR